MSDAGPDGVPPSTIAIVGAGQAGAWAVHTLRDSGFAGRILMFGDEGRHPYERPPLSKAVLLGEATPESTQVFPPDSFAALGVEFFADDPVVDIDRAARRVTTISGAAFGYDRLLLCTGGRARPLTVPGAELPCVYSLRSLVDARRLGDALRAARSVAVVGGGWIGLEVAAAARGLGAEVVVLESQSRLCQRGVPQSVSDELLELHRRAGVDVRLAVQLERLEPGSSSAARLLLRGGEAVAADVVVSGVGLLPNDELAQRCGLDLAQGVLVDRQCRTSDPAIYAAGDVAVAPNSWFGGAVRLESWQNAQNQSIAAARAALGQAVSYDPLPWFWSRQYDANIEILGFPSRAARELRRRNPRDGSLLRIFLDGQRPVAAVGINVAREIRAARRLIEARVDVTDAALLDSAADLAKLAKSR